MHARLCCGGPLTRASAQVGEFLEALTALGATEDDPLIRRGMTFLLRSQVRAASALLQCARPHRRTRSCPMAAGTVMQAATRTLCTMPPWLARRCDGGLLLLWSVTERARACARDCCCIITAGLDPTLLERQRCFDSGRLLR